MGWFVMETDWILIRCSDWRDGFGHTLSMSHVLSGELQPETTFVFLRGEMKHRFKREMIFLVILLWMILEILFPC